ncbi:NaeI family type II restriction endonuclease [Streptomyces deccanensis]|uniref:NaeI family type II restriction endonuclease n=1 Tax=Streptomyces deccanensis TaxID=424188 RepID=UPI001EFBEF77|nr:NaeI family type II restriction endonuclease [Streptomyces deccanensis]ULR50923.1 restriction endonuclease [Streptomyces deccanensis]
MEYSLFSRDIAAAQNIAQSAPATEVDPKFLEVHEWFKSQPNLEDRFGQVIRQSIDEVLDGQRTGRFNIRDLEKTEKTYLGTKVEIITRAEFGLNRGKSMDFSVCGHDVDSKFTIGSNWTIPREADQHICLLIKADDHRGTFRVGLLRIRDDLMNAGENRDRKRSPSAAGRAAIRWIVPDGRLPENILLRLSESDREAIFKNTKSGQSRTNELFRCPRAQGRIVNRNTVLTVARQDDSLKRVRDARNQLRSAGIIILGHQGQHPHIARSLDLPVPSKGTWVAVRVTEVGDLRPNRKSAQIADRNYAVWSEGDTPSAAPPNY